MAAGAAAAFAAAFLALTFGLADLSAGEARRFLFTTVAPRIDVPSDRWQRAVDGLDRAEHLQPWSADYLADRARLYEWQSWQQVRSPDRARAFRTAALLSYREALALRPTWGYAWAELAESVTAARGFDDEARVALARAARLAPWERQVQKRIVWLGLTTWPALDDDSRAIVRATVARAWTIGNGRRELTRLAAQYGWSDELARVAPGGPGAAD